MSIGSECRNSRAAPVSAFRINLKEGAKLVPSCISCINQTTLTFLNDSNFNYASQFIGEHGGFDLGNERRGFGGKAITYTGSIKRPGDFEKESYVFISTDMVRGVSPKGVLSEFAQGSDVDLLWNCELIQIGQGIYP